MTEGSIVIDCWGELFYVTPGLGLELGFDGPQGFPLPFHNELSVAMFLGTLSSFDLSLLSQRFSPKALHGHKDLQRAIMRGRLLVFPMDTPISLVSAVQNGGRSNQVVSGKSNLGALNTKKLSAYSSANNDLMCVNRTQKVIRSEIRTVLRQIVEQERIESRKIEKAYKNKSTLGKAGAHINHFRKGLHEATGSFLTWLKEVNDVVSINQRLFRILIASNIANHANSDERFEVYQKVLTALEKKEIVEALGFDPSLITAEKVTEVYSLAKLIHDDHATQLIIKHFIRYYIDAQHQLEWSEIAGGATFEIILTAFLAVVTGGVGAIASLGAQARKLSQMKKLGELFIELAELLKKVPKAKVLTMRKQKEGEEKEQRKKEQKPPPVKQDKVKDDTIQEDNVASKKAIRPNSLEEAENILKLRREKIVAEGYKPKYTDAELVNLAQHGDIGSDRFQVRFMEKNYLNDRNSPDEPLSGKMGMVMKGETGEGAKYWSTSFDQLEDADSDPRLISEKLGLEYDPKTKYALIIVDTDKSAPLTGIKSVPATFENLGEFVNTELPLDFPKSFTNKAMTPEFQAEYAKHYGAAVESGDLPNSWSRDTGSFRKYLQATDLPADEQKLHIKRMKMHDKIGNNQYNLGNGLTKDMNPDSSNDFGVVETLNFERKTINLNELDEAGAISIVKDLQPL